LSQGQDQTPNEEEEMSDLLEKAIAAHGGWHCWQKLTKLTAQANIGGRLWPASGKGGILDDVRIVVDAHLLTRNRK
jgi:hypothetical protein